MQGVRFQAVSRPAFSGGLGLSASAPAPLDDLHAAWRHPDVRPLIEASIVHGNFKADPNGARRFLDTLDAACNERNASNEDRYGMLRETFESLQQDNRAMASQFAEEKDERVARRIDQVAELLGGFSPVTYVDIGSGDGKITAGLTALMKPPSLNVGARDVFPEPPRQAIGLEVAPSGAFPKAVAVLQYDGQEFPLRQNAIDMMSLFAVLHHVEDPMRLLRGAKDCLRPGGKLVVREFDAGTEASKRFNIVMDDMLYKVYSPNPDVPCPGNFMSRADWLDLFREAGFRVSKLIADPEPTNPYKPFMVALEKP